MKLLPGLLSALMALSAAPVRAQNPTPSSPPASPPGTANASQTALESQKSETKSKPTAFKEDHLFDPPATAAVRDALNVRGQPTLTSEVVAHLHKGDTASVLESLTLRKPRKNEPANWARIALPLGTPVWVFADYIDTNSMTVLPNRVNLRGGPGENYSVLGRLEKGAAVKEAGKRNGWIQIETPANASGFVALEYLELQTNPPPAAVESKPETAPVSAPAVAAAAPTVAAPPPPAPEPAKPEAIVAPEPKAATLATATPAPAPAPVPEAAPAAQVPPPVAKTVERIISREGVLRRAYNIQAPADYELRAVTSGEVIDYIQPQPKQDLKSYVGARVLVTGAEVLDPRWPRTPILEVQTLDRVP